MQSVIKVISLIYLVFMTLLLLSSDPAGLIGMHGRLLPVLQWLMPAAHLLSFLTLAVLVLGSRWPAPRWIMVLILVFYGGMTELAQYLVPTRTPEWQDWFMDLAGIAIGATICWTVATFTGALMRARRRRCPAAPSDEWELMQKVMSRPSSGGQSWWA